MADNVNYFPSYSFSGWQANNPTRPLPAPRIDEQFVDISNAINQNATNLGQIRRSDGGLRNGIVGHDQLSPTLSIGFRLKGEWEVGQIYDTGDGVVLNGVFYSADEQHLSTPLNAPEQVGSQWTKLFAIADVVVDGILQMPVDYFTGDGFSTIFPLPYTPLARNNLIVAIGGIVQPVNSYGIEGDNVVFLNPPRDGYPIEVRGFTTTAASVVEGSVEAYMIRDFAVTTPKLAENAVTHEKLSEEVFLDIDRRALKSTVISTGDGLEGGGDLSADREIRLSDASQASLAKADSAVQPYDTVASVATATVPSTVNAIRANGYQAAGDGGGSLYKRVGVEPTHSGKIRSVDGAWWENASYVVNVKDFGAKGDGITPDDEAIAAAMSFAFRSSTLTVNKEVYFPSGDYLLTEPNAWGRWTSSPAMRQYVKFRGDGWMSSTIVFRPTGTGDTYLYDGRGTNGLLMWIVEDMGFSFFNDNVIGGAACAFYSNGILGKAEQGWQFYRCRFLGHASHAYAPTLLRLGGTVNSSEMSFFGCRSRAFKHIIHCTNTQAVNHYIFGCDWENHRGDIYKFERGGSMLHYGGSIIMENGVDVGDFYILNVPSDPATGTSATFNFKSLRLEARVTEACLVSMTGNNNIGRAVFEGCDLGRVVSGGDRAAVVISSRAACSVEFQSCNLVDQRFFYRFLPMTANLWLSQRGGGEIHLDRCTIHTQIYEKITWDNVNTRGIMRIRNAKFPTGSSGEFDPAVVTSADLTRNGWSKPKNLIGPELKSAGGFIRIWPATGRNPDGAQTQLQLPPACMIKNIRLRKRAFSTQSNAYQLALVNGAGTVCYGLSTDSAQRLQHDISAQEIWRRTNLTDLQDSIVKVICTTHIAISGGSGTFQVGELITGGTSSATARVLKVESGLLIVGLGEGTFYAAETITGGTSTATAVADTITLKHGANTNPDMTEDDIFVVDYY